MNDSDLPPATTPRFWIAFTILCLTFVVAFVMAVFSSTEVKAQERQVRCGPIRTVVDLLAVSKERVMWSGVTAQGAAELLLFQSPRETWSMVTVQNGIGCIVETGNAGTPIENGKGV